MHLRFQRLLFGATSIPFTFNATVKYRLDLQPDENWVAADMKCSIYVDNLATSVDDESRAIQYHGDAQQIFAGAGMSLREWMSNSSKVRETIAPSKLTTNCKMKVLGVNWNAEMDTLNVVMPNVENEASLRGTLTKRFVCSLVAQLFDPLGVLDPFTIRGKILLQELWKMKVEWDDTLPEEILD